MLSGDQKRGGFAIPSTTGRNPVTELQELLLIDLDTIAEASQGFVLRTLTIRNVSSGMIQRAPCFIVIHRIWIVSIITAIPLHRMTTVRPMQNYFTA